MQEASAERGLEPRLASPRWTLPQLERMLMEEPEDIMQRYTAQILARSGEQKWMQDKFNELWRTEQQSKLITSFDSSVQDGSVLIEMNRTRDFERDRSWLFPMSAT
jgi:hypothetical protein